VSLDSCIQAFFADHMVDDLRCSVCGKNTSWVQSKRFKTFPKYLVVVLQRFVLHNWVPKKLDVNLTLNTEAMLSLEAMKGNGLQPGELAMPEAAESDEMEPPMDQNLVN